MLPACPCLTGPEDTAPALPPTNLWLTLSSTGSKRIAHTCIHNTCERCADKLNPLSIFPDYRDTIVYNKRLSLFSFSQVVLQRSSGLDETGTIVWPLALSLLLSSIIIAAVMVKGIKSSGKVSLLSFDLTQYTLDTQYTDKPKLQCQHECVVLPELTCVTCAVVKLPIPISGWLISTNCWLGTHK